MLDRLVLDAKSHRLWLSCMAIEGGTSLTNARVHCLLEAFPQLDIILVNDGQVTLPERGVWFGCELTFVSASLALICPGTSASTTPTVINRQSSLTWKVSQAVEHLLAQEWGEHLVMINQEVKRHGYKEARRKLRYTAKQKGMLQITMRRWGCRSMGKRLQSGNWEIQRWGISANYMCRSPAGKCLGLVFSG